MISTLNLPHKHKYAYQWEDTLEYEENENTRTSWLQSKAYNGITNAPLS